MRRHLREPDSDRPAQRRLSGPMGFPRDVKTGARIRPANARNCRIVAIGVEPETSGA